MAAGTGPRRSHHRRLRSGGRMGGSTHEVPWRAAGPGEHVRCGTRLPAARPLPYAGQMTPLRDPDSPSPERHAVVVGAGINGLAVAGQLAADGWTVDVLEQAPAPRRAGYMAGRLHDQLLRPRLRRRRGDGAAARVATPGRVVRLAALCRRHRPDYGENDDGHLPPRRLRTV